MNLIKTELLSMTEQQIKYLMPYLIMIGGASLAMVASLFHGVFSKWATYLVSLATIILAFAWSYQLMGQEPVVLFNQMMAIDSYAVFFNLIFLGTAFFTLLVSFRYLDQDQIQYPDFYLLVLFSAIGMMLLAAALDLIVIFIALEIMSLAIYSLVGFRRYDRRSNEAALKYFVLGGAAAAVYLYGSALIYGACGSLNIKEMIKFVNNANATGISSLYLLGLALVLVGFLFKVASVPFHMWMPDVYEGAPVPVTGFMTTGLKAAAFAVFVRVFVNMGYGKGLPVIAQSHLHDILWVLAVLTLVVGNVVALTQNNLKRLLAFSSIAHTGYLLVGIIAAPGSEKGYMPIVVYLVSYALMNLGAFAILTVLSDTGDSKLSIHDLAGLSKRRPFLAFGLATFIFSMAGIPPTVGFVAKYLLFYGAIQSGEVILAIIAVLCSAISVYYYLRVIVFMYMKEPAESFLSENKTKTIAFGAAITIGLMVFFTFELGILPMGIFGAAKKAVLGL